MKRIERIRGKKKKKKHWVVTALSRTGINIKQVIKQRWGYSFHRQRNVIFKGQREEFHHPKSIKQIHMYKKKTKVVVAA